MEKKLINIPIDCKEWLDKKAKEKYMTTNQLIRNILIEYYLENKREGE